MKNFMIILLWNFIRFFSLLSEEGEDINDNLHKNVHLNFFLSSKERFWSQIKTFFLPINS